MGDVVRTASVIDDSINMMRRWSKKGIFDKALRRSIPLGWLGPDRDKLWLVIDDVCPEIYAMREEEDVRDFLGVRFYRCRSAGGSVVVCPGSMLEKI